MPQTLMFIKTGYFQLLYSIAEVLIPVFSPIYLMVPAPSLQIFVAAALPPLDVPQNNIYFSGGVTPDCLNTSRE